MDPRSKAVETLCQLQRRRATVREVWDGPRTGAETALVLGTLRRRATLDAILQAHSTRKLVSLKPESLAALRAGLFELLFLDGAPVHAVVHAAVENVKRSGRFKDTGFVNALLRAAVRGGRREPTGGSTDPRRTLPRGDLRIVFSKSVFPDPKAKPAAFLAARASTAPWIAERRLGELGFDRALLCLDLQAETPRIHLRPAPERREEVVAALTAAGLGWEEGPHDALLTLPAGARTSEVFAACGPWITVQDAVASQVAPFLAPPAGARVLDYCAAPGGKATHLAELVGRSGEVTAWDADPRRLERVHENAERLGLVQLRCGEPAGSYDAVLVDAPCSNTGVLARRPEARWRVRERHLKGLAERQLAILKEAARHVRAGGAVVYSTCSLEPEENAGVLRDFLAAEPGFLLETARTIYPDEGAGDGGFMARLRAV